MQENSIFYFHPHPFHKLKITSRSFLLYILPNWLLVVLQDNFLLDNDATTTHTRRISARNHRHQYIEKLSARTPKCSYARSLLFKKQSNILDFKLCFFVWASICFLYIKSANFLKAFKVLLDFFQKISEFEIEPQGLSSFPDSHKIKKILKLD